MAYGTINADLMTTSDGVSSSGLYGFKNRIINGAMQINQRGTVSTPVTPSSGDYTLDRYRFFASQASKITITQSTDAPTGFINSLLATTAIAYTPSGSDYFAINQRIEGLNISDLAWGSASAKAVTISFWVKSSLTGTFAGTLQNSAGNYSYPFTYTISSASTWTQIVLLVAGPTSGTWLTTNGIGIVVQFDLGYGTTYNGTANTWASGDYENVSGAVNMVATGSATLQFAGVQLEKGSTATSFDYRPYTTELQLCQRYYYRITATNIANGTLSSSTTGYYFRSHPVTMRTSPTATATASGWTLRNIGPGADTLNATIFGFNESSTTGYAFSGSGTAGGGALGVGSYCTANSGSSYADWSSEL